MTLGARDMPRLRAFYAGLGWKEQHSGSDDFACFLAGGVLLALYPIGELAKEAAPAEPAPSAVWGGIALACNVDTKEDVDAAFAAAVAAGATPVSEPEDRFWGGRSGYVADPEGNRWELAWAPMAKFDERGALVAFG